MCTGYTILFETKSWDFELHQGVAVRWFYHMLDYANSGQLKNSYDKYVYTTLGTFMFCMDEQHITMQPLVRVNQQSEYPMPQSS